MEWTNEKIKVSGKKLSYDRIICLFLNVRNDGYKIKTRKRSFKQYLEQGQGRTGIQKKNKKKQESNKDKNNIQE